MSLRNPELQRLLDSLRNASNTSLVQDITTNNKANAHIITQKVEPLASTTTPTNLSPAHDATLLARRNLRPEEHRSRSSTPSTQAGPDASTIVTWPAAIKHVARTIITSETASSRIRHLIDEQRKHEQQWWTQREAILARQNGRAHSNAKVADILKGLGGSAGPVAKVDETAHKNELDAFDKKVYKSLIQMASDFDGQLRQLGVPFFAIKHDLVLRESQVEDNLARTGRLDKGELRDLQKRMLQYLEDLVMDE